MSNNIIFQKKKNSNDIEKAFWIRLIYALQYTISIYFRKFFYKKLKKLLKKLDNFLFSH